MTAGMSGTRALESLESRRMLSLAAAAATVDPVIEWDSVLIDTLRADRTLPGPTWASRSGAMVHAAIYDAVNSIDHIGNAYLTNVKAPKGASLTAAAAAAAWRVLSSLYPDQQASLDAALETSLARVKDGPMEDQGVAVGLACADAIIAARNNDGSNIDVTYVSNPAAGHWQPASPDQTTPLGVNWGGVTPFTMDSCSQFRPPPAPAMTSLQYALAYAQVKSLGAKNSTTRTAEQTQIGMFWGYDRAGMGAPPSLYNQITQVIAAQQHNSIDQNARLFALTNLAMADAGIASWDCKYVDDFWRPITAIRRGDEDGNPLTVKDATWEPLGAPGGGVIDNFTPPFPAYVSGHATFGAAVFESLGNFFGRDDIHFTIHSDELPGVTRSFNSFSQAAAENGISRIYLGIHWSFDNVQGQALGRSIADFLFAHELGKNASLLATSLTAEPPPVTFIASSGSTMSLLQFDKRAEELV
jgi:hypothetical protein